MTRWLAALVVVLGLLSAMVAPADARPRPRDPRPNIVVLQTDDQTAASLKFMPQVNRLLGRAGTTFEQYFASYPLCCPSRATYFTGQYAHTNGVTYNYGDHGGFHSFENIETTFPVALQRAGYETTHIGKYLNGYGVQRPRFVPPGWSDWQGSIDPFTYRYYGFVLNDNGNLRKFGPDEYQTNVYTQLAVDKIRSRAHKKGPFFLDVAYLAPHAVKRETSGLDPADNDAVGAPHSRRGIRYPVPLLRDLGKLATEPVPNRRAFDERDVSDKPMNIQARREFSASDAGAIHTNYHLRLETLLAVDRGVRRIVHALAETRQLDNTYIIFLSDNGFFHGEHRIPFGKFLPYEPSIRVPLVVRGPNVRQGVRTRALASNVDLAPTILRLARAHPLRPPDGRSLVSLLRNRKAKAPAAAVLIESGANPVGAPVYHGVRTARYKLVEYEDGGRELYDLQRDPQELDNRFGDARLRMVQARLERRLARLIDCHGAACRRASA